MLSSSSSSSSKSNTSSGLALLNEGSISAVFVILRHHDENDNNIDDTEDSTQTQVPNVVLKTTLLSDEDDEKYTPVDPDSIYSRQIDVVVSDRNTPKSPYIVATYGYCGIAVLVPQATHSLLDYIQSVRVGGEELSSIDKLKVASQLSKAVADLHDLNTNTNTGVPAFVHNDLSVDQFLYSKTTGLVQLNDFNLATIGSRNVTMTTTTIKDKGTPASSACFVDPNMAPFMHQAPEALQHYIAHRSRYKSNNNKSTTITPVPFVQHYAEIFSLGSALYLLLTIRYMFNVPEQQEQGFELLIQANGPC